MNLLNLEQVFFYFCPAWTAGNVSDLQSCYNLGARTAVAYTKNIVGKVFHEFLTFLKGTLAAGNQEVTKYHVSNVLQTYIRLTSTVKYWASHSSNNISTNHNMRILWFF